MGSDELIFGVGSQIHELLLRDVRQVRAEVGVLVVVIDPCPLLLGTSTGSNSRSLWWRGLRKVLKGVASGGAGIDHATSRLQACFICGSYHPKALRGGPPLSPFCGC